jgi:hypothetical protein
LLRNRAVEVIDRTYLHGKAQVVLDLPPTEQGLVDEPFSPLHAAARGLGGLNAVCGAGKLVQLVPGRFDPDNPNACPSCVEALREEVNSLEQTL